MCNIDKMDEVLSGMDFDFLGQGKHRITATCFLALENAVMLDVRTNQERENLDFKMNNFCEVIRIPLNELPTRLKEIPQDRYVGTFCVSGFRSAVAAFYLQSRGYSNVHAIAGGYPEMTAELKTGKVFKKLNS